MEVKQSKNKLLVPVLIGGVVVIAIVLCAVLLAGSGAKKVAKTFGQGLTQGKASKFCEYFNSEILEEDWNMSDSDCEDLVENAFDEMEFKSYRYTAKKVDKDEIEDIADQLEDVYDIDASKVKKVVRFKLTYKRKESDDSSWEKRTMYMWVAKIKGKWSIVGMTKSKDFATGMEDEL